MFNKTDNWFLNKAPANGLLQERNGRVVGIDEISFFRRLPTINTGSLVATSSLTASYGTFYRINSISANINFELPLASLNEDKEIGFKIQTDNMNGKVVVLNTSGSETIDGKTSWTLTIARQSIVLKSDGVSEWMII